MLFRRITNNAGLAQQVIMVATNDKSLVHMA